MRAECKGALSSPFIIQLITEANNGQILFHFMRPIDTRRGEVKTSAFYFSRSGALNEAFQSFVGSLARVSAVTTTISTANLGSELVARERL